MAGPDESTERREQRCQVSVLRPATVHQSPSRAGHRTGGHSRTRNAGAITLQAWIAHEEGDKSRARELCAEATACVPKNPELAVVRILAQLHIQLGDDENGFSVRFGNRSPFRGYGFEINP